MSIEEIICAAKKANIHNFISNLPMVYLNSFINCIKLKFIILLSNMKQMLVLRVHNYQVVKNKELL